MAGFSFGDAIPASVSATELEKIEKKKKKVSPFDADFAKLAQETLIKWHLPGVALAVIDGDETFAEVFTTRETVWVTQS